MIKSPNDKQTYREIVLKNGLRVLLVSTLKPDKATAVATAGKRRADSEGAPESQPKRICKPTSSHGSSETRTQSHYNEVVHPSVEPEDDANMKTSSNLSLVESTCDGVVDNLPDDGSKDLSDELDASSYPLHIAAAAMCLSVGSLSEPANLHGLAHFVEHMVFMGSKKYPSVDDFDECVIKNHGIRNAETDWDRTTFYFDIRQLHFEEALDIFAQFFIFPLMKEDCIDKELKTIDNEFHERTTSDYIRTEQLLLTTTLTPGHPMAKLMRGNEYTLKTLAKDHGFDIYQECRDFHARYYTAQNMTLVVQAYESLAYLEELVERTFSSIPNNGLPQPTHYRESHFDMEAFHRLYKVVPVEDVVTLTLHWSFSKVANHYRSKPILYILHLLQHEGDGSIMSYLRTRLWAKAIKCNVMVETTLFLLVHVQVLLTDIGLTKVNDILTVIFEYLKMLRFVGPQESFYDEMSRIKQNVFDWQEMERHGKVVKNLSMAMHLYKPEDYLAGETLMLEYNPQLIRQFLALFTPERCNVMIHSKSFESLPDLREEFWYKTKYSVTDFESSWTSKWENLNRRLELHLPALNPYVATNFSIKNKVLSPAYFFTPKKIRSTKKVKIWYHQDKTFRKPRGYIYLRLMSPVVSETQRSQAMIDLFAALLQNNMKETLFLANNADLKCEFHVDNAGLVIMLQGYDDKLSQFFQTIIDNIVEFAIRDEWFDIIKDQQKKTYYNSLLKRDELAMDLLNHLVVDVQHAKSNKCTALRSVQKDDLLAFVDKYLKTLFIEGYAYGNFLIEEVHAMADYLEKNFEENPLSATSISEERVVQLPIGTRYCRVSNFNASDPSSYIMNYYQIGPCNIHNSLLTQLLRRVMKNALYQELRSKLQLGYDVYCNFTQYNGIWGLIIVVNYQAKNHSARSVDDTIEDFLVTYEQQLAGWKVKKLPQYLQSFVAYKQLGEGTMEREAMRNWLEILDQSYKFDREKLEAQEAKKLSLNELLPWFRATFSKSRRKKLSIQVIASGEEKHSQKVLKYRMPRGLNDSDRSLASTSATGLKRPTALDPSDCFSSANLAPEVAKNYECEYLQDKQSDDQNDPNSIGDPEAFKNSQPLYPVRKTLE